MASNEDTLSSPTLTENERMKIIILANNPSATLEGLKELVNDLSFVRCSDVMSMKSPWNPTLRLEDGELAKDKALALMNRRGTQVSPHGAIHRIMLENAKAFQLPLPKHWNAETFPGGIRAIERAIYLVEREDFSASAAMECIMFEFPGTFFEDVPPQWTNAHTDAQNAVLKIGKNRVKHDGIDAMSCIKSIMSEPELREAFDPDESSVVNYPHVPDQLPVDEGQVVLDIDEVDVRLHVPDQPPMSQDDDMATFTVTVSRAGVANVGNFTFSSGTDLDNLTVLTFADLMSVEDQETKSSGMSWESFVQAIQMKQQKPDAESAYGPTSFGRVLTYAMSNTNPYAMPTEDHKTSIVVTPTQKDKKMPLEDQKAMMERLEQSHIFNQGIQTEQEVEGTKSDAENNSEPRDTHDEVSTLKMLFSLCWHIPSCCD